MRKKYLLKNLLVTFAILLIFAVSSLWLSYYYNNRQAKSDILKISEVYRAQIAAAEYSADINRQKEIFGAIITVDDSVKDEMRVTVLSSDGGEVLAESSEVVTPQSDREEIVNAAKGGDGFVSRKSHTYKNTTMIYHAVKTAYGSDKVILRVAFYVKSVNAYVLPVSLLFLLLLAAGTAAYFFLAERIIDDYAQPLKNLNRALIDISEGKHSSLNLEDIKYDENKELVSSIYSLNMHIAGQIEQLEKERNTLKTILGNMGQGVIAIDDRREIVLINGRAEEIFQVKHAEGKNYIYLFRSEKVFEQVRDAVDKAAVSLFNITLDNMTYSVGVYPAEKLRSGIRFVIVVTDITLETNAANMRKEFFENASHELKTPLTSICGFSELLAMQSTDERVKKYADNIMRDAERMMLLLNDMLYVSKIESDMTQPAEAESTDLRAVVDETVALLQPQILSKNIKVSVDGKGFISLNGEMTVKLVQNIVANAVSYNKPDGKIDIAIRPDSKKVVLTVKDTGLGIARENLPRVFERFYRVDKSRSKHSGGTGLGLAIVKHIAEKQNIEIKLESSLGVGSTFTVIFKPVKNK